jgi:hypothetical protein
MRPSFNDLRRQANQLRQTPFPKHLFLFLLPSHLSFDSDAGLSCCVDLAFDGKYEVPPIIDFLFPS